MDPIEKRELKRRAWAKLAAQKRRAGLLRGRVVISSLICFALLWGIVFTQMATGNDPVLSAKEATVATRPTTHVAKRAKKKAKATVEAEPEAEEVEAAATEGEAVEAEAEPVEPEFVEEPLVTSQS